MKTPYTLTVKQTVPVLCAGLLVAGCRHPSYDAPVVYQAPSREVISRPVGPGDLYRVPPPPPVFAPSVSTTALPAPSPRPEAPLAETAPAQPESQTGPFASSAERVVIPLHSEEVHVGTREVENGAVRLRKVIKTETVNQPVTLRREELVIDRLPADAAQPNVPNTGQVVDLNQPFSEQSITIPVRREEPVVQTEVVQTGQVVARKNVTSESTTVQRPIRKEDVEVVRVGEPQNVSIAPGLTGQGAANRTGTGSAPDFQAGTASATDATGPIASLATLANAPDLTALVRRPVNLANAVVREVTGRSLLALEAPAGQVFHVLTSESLAGIRPGDRVNLRGRIEAVPRTLRGLGLTPEAEQVLKSDPIYIDATEIRRAIAPERP